MGEHESGGQGTAIEAGKAPPQGSRPRRRRSLRSTLILMLFAPLVPLLLLCAAALWYQWKSHTEQTYESLADTAAAISVAIEREIDGSKASLETLAASDFIDAKDWAALHRNASGAIKNERDSFIALTAPSGTQPVRTMLPYGAPTVNPSALARSHTDTEWNGRRLPLSTQGLAQRVFDTGKPSNSGLYFGVSIKQPAVAIAIPVVRDGRVAYVLIKGFAVNGLVKLLQDAERTNVRISLIDRNGKIIARNDRPAEAIGSTVSAALLAAMEAKQHGTREGTDFDGFPTMAAFRRLDSVDWTVNVSMPKSAALALATKQFAIWLLLGLSLIAVGLYGARRFWLRVAPTIALLGQAAPALQRGEAVDLPHSDIAEIDDLAALLRKAAVAEKRERIEATRRTVAEERERAARELVAAVTRSETRFRTLFEHSGTGIALIELATGRFTLVNSCLCEITGYSEEELLQQGLAAIAHPDDLSRDAAAVRALAAGRQEGCDKEKRYIRKDGAVRWVELHVRKFPEAEADKGVILASLSDITERKEAEIALKEAGQRKDEFLATLAHELRNPLAPVRSGIEILRLRDNDPAVVSRVRAVMDRQVTHMVRLIDDLLEVSRITTGRLVLHEAVVNLADIVGESVETCQSVLDAGGHKLSVTIEDAPLAVMGDRTRLAQVLGNLLANAAKYTRPSGEISLTAFAREDKVVISVRDTGIGIPADKLEPIFDMFTQVRALHGNDKNPGLGIGLHIVKRVVELHHGTVVAKSAGEGFGSEFVVELPLLREPIAARPPQHVARATSSPLHILVVDDNRDAAESLASLLTMLGHSVQTALAGTQALEVVAAACPDVILLDVGMPGLDGHEVARRIRAAPLRVQPVIVAVSGWGQAGDKIKTASSGFDYHLVKPVAVADLQGTIAAALKSRHSAG